jgi:hypothetical protein
MAVKCFPVLQIARKLHCPIPPAVRYLQCPIPPAVRYYPTFPTYVFVSLHYFVCTCMCVCVFVLWIAVLWDMTPCNSLLYPEVGGSSFLRNVRTCPHNYKASHSRSQQSSWVPSREPPVPCLLLLIFKHLCGPYFSHFSVVAPYSDTHFHTAHYGVSV